MSLGVLYDSLARVVLSSPAKVHCASTAESGITGMMADGMMRQHNMSLDGRNPTYSLEAFLLPPFFQALKTCPNKGDKGLLRKANSS